MILQRVLMLLVLMAGCSLACPGQGKIVVTAPAESEVNDWKEFSSAEGRFSVLFPGTPISKATESQTAVGKVTSYAFTLKLPAEYYHVSYMVYPKYSDDPDWAKQTLDAGRDGMFSRNRNMELLAETPLTIGNFPGREFLILHDRFSFSILRTFIVHDRLYLVSVLVPIDVGFKNGRATTRPEDRTQHFTGIAKKFFDSFEVADVVETLDEVDRTARELTKKNQGLITVAANPRPEAPIIGGVVNGRAVRLVTPAYPDVARAAHASGSVSVKVLIDLQGNVAAAAAIEGHPLLRPAAIQAARESKFTPTSLEGKPVMVLGVIVYNFVAQ